MSLGNRMLIVGIIFSCPFFMCSNPPDTNSQSGRIAPPQWIIGTWKSADHAYTWKFSSDGAIKYDHTVETDYVNGGSFHDTVCIGRVIWGKTTSSYGIIDLAYPKYENDIFIFGDSISTSGDTISLEWGHYNSYEDYYDSKILYKWNQCCPK